LFDNDCWIGFLGRASEVPMGKKGDDTYAHYGCYYDREKTPR
jgi:hypothetical protein